MKGKVKWFNHTRGIGFIASEDGTDDFFVHYTQIRGQEGYRDLKQGQEVEFTLIQGPKGPMAGEVKVI